MGLFKLENQSTHTPKWKRERILIVVFVEILFFLNKIQLSN
jgi:hypothetical protein